LLHTLSFVNAHFCQLYSVFIAVRPGFCTYMLQGKSVCMINSHYHFGKRAEAVAEISDLCSAKSLMTFFLLILFDVSCKHLLLSIGQMCGLKQTLHVLH